VQALPSKNTSIPFLANSDDEGLVYVVNGWNLVASDEQVKIIIKSRIKFIKIIKIRSLT